MNHLRDPHLSNVPCVLDLFCGAGGLSLGFQMAGYQIDMGIEIDPLASLTHSVNFQHPHEPLDITAIKNPRHFLRQHDLALPQVIIGGPPCQGFSRVGRGKLRHLRNGRSSTDDPRNRYWLEFVRFVKRLRPLYFVMENVPDLVHYKYDGLLIDRIMDTFQNELGYTTEWRILRADHFGVPQTRDRLIIIGNRLRHQISWPCATHDTNPITVWQAISDLPLVHHEAREDVIPYIARCELNEYQRLMREGAGDVVSNHQTRWHNQQDLHAFDWLPEGGRYIELPARFKRYRDDIFEDKYRKLVRDRPSWTIEAHIGKDTYRHIYPSRQGEPEPPRTISVREAARLQSFPDRFRFTGPFCKQFQQLGNAVPPLLACAVASAILPGVLAGMNRTPYPRMKATRKRLIQNPLPMVG